MVPERYDAPSPLPRALVFFHCAIRHSSFIDNRYSGCGVTHWRNPMRYIVYISVILAAMLVAKITNLPRGATASHNSDTMNVLQSEQTVEEK